MHSGERDQAHADHERLSRLRSSIEELRRAIYSRIEEGRDGTREMFLLREQLYRTRAAEAELSTPGTESRPPRKWWRFWD